MYGNSFILYSSFILYVARDNRNTIRNTIRILDRISDLYANLFGDYWNSIPNSIRGTLIFCQFSWRVGVELQNDHDSSAAEQTSDLGAKFGREGRKESRN